MLHRLDLIELHEASTRHRGQSLAGGVGHQMQMETLQGHRLAPSWHGDLWISCGSGYNRPVFSSVPKSVPARHPAVDKSAGAGKPAYPPAGIAGIDDPSPYAPGLSHHICTAIFVLYQCLTIFVRSIFHNPGQDSRAVEKPFGKTRERRIPVIHSHPLPQLPFLLSLTSILK